MKKHRRLHLISAAFALVFLFFLWYLKYGGDRLPVLPELFRFRPQEAEEKELVFTLPEAETAEETEARLTVYVSGEVSAPGVYFFLPGDRAYLAVERAGGFTENADRDAVNLALPLKDGEQLKIPAKRSGGETGAGPVKININTADTETLTKLSGIGEAKAKAIIAYRQRNGPFEAPEELKNVSGIGEALYQNIAEDICTE